MSLIGIDIGSYDEMFEMNREHKIDFFQISAKYVSQHLDRIASRKEELDLPTFTVVSHYSYTINLAHTWSSTDWWIQQLISEIRAADRIGAFGLVIHTGKSMNYSQNSALNNMFSSLLYVHNQTKDSKIKLLIETPAGQGTELLSNIEDFTNFMKKFSNNPELSDRFGICVDTCHIYAAGYDISTRKGIAQFFDTIHQGVGMEKVRLVHLNNSRGELGSAIDRHDNIKTGDLSYQAIETIVKFINQLEIPMVLETPTGDDYQDILEDYQILKKIVK